MWSATVKNNYKRATLLHIYLMCNGNDWQSGGREDSSEWREELGTKENNTGEGFLFSGHHHDGRLVLLPPEKLGSVPHHALYTNSRPMNRAQVRRGERKKASGP